MRCENAYRRVLRAIAGEWPNTVPPSRRNESRRASGPEKWKLPQRFMDPRSTRGASLAAVLGSNICKARELLMNKENKAIKPLPAKGVRRTPVRLKLQRVHAHLAKPHPPDGLRMDWWERLKSAFGTSSSAFVEASLYQLQAAARLPCSGISEIAVNAALAMIEAAEPKDEVEAALAVQMACTHTAAMAVLARLGGGGGSERRLTSVASAASRLLRAYTEQVEVFRRLRRGPDQVIRIERVDVHEGGQAIVGAVRTSSP